VNHSTGRPTKAQQRRFDDLKQMGCIIELIRSGRYRPPDIHHICEGGKRKGHDFTLPLSSWHNRGWEPNMTKDESYAILGPSFYNDKAEFIKEYGTELELLDKVNEML